MQEAEPVTQKLSPGPQRSCRKLKLSCSVILLKDLVGEKPNTHPSSLYSLFTGWFSRVEGGLGLSHVLFCTPSPLC